MPRRRPFIDGGVGDVHSFENNPAPDHLVLGVTHDGHEERGLAGAVWSEQNMGLSRIDLEIDVFEYRFSRKLHLQIFYH